MAILKAYIDELRIQQRESVQSPSPPPRSDNRLRCTNTLDVQIVALMRSLPPAHRERPWSIRELVASLEGKYQVRPAAGEVGLALRRLGWIRHRDWSKAGGGRRIWRVTTGNLPML